jgi:hypothetical protein
MDNLQLPCCSNHLILFPDVPMNLRIIRESKESNFTIVQYGDKNVDDDDGNCWGSEEAIDGGKETRKPMNVDRFADGNF